MLSYDETLQLEEILELPAARGKELVAAVWELKREVTDNRKNPVMQNACAIVDFLTKLADEAEYEDGCAYAPQAKELLAGLYDSHVIVGEGQILKTKDQGPHWCEEPDGSINCGLPDSYLIGNRYIRVLPPVFPPRWQPPPRMDTLIRYDGQDYWARIVGDTVQYFSPDPCSRRLADVLILDPDTGLPREKK